MAGMPATAFGSLQRAVKPSGDGRPVARAASTPVSMPGPMNFSRGAADGIPAARSNAGPQPDPGALARQRAFDFAYIARNNNLGGQFTDKQTGATYYTPGSASGSSSGSRGPSGGGDDDGGRWEDTFEADMARVQPYMPPAPAPAPAPPPPGDPSASNSAAFSRAKDRIGKLGRGAMDSLSRAMASRNLSGSTMEGNAISNIVGGTQGELGDVIRDQAIEGYAREGHVADRNLNYQLQTRGQDIDAQRSRFSHLQGLMGLLRASRRRVAY